MAGSRSVASFAISSALSFPPMPICPGIHDTLIVACLLLSRKVVAVSTNFCDVCWLDPGVSFVISVTGAVLYANITILDRLLFASGISCWNSIAVSNSCQDRLGVQWDSYLGLSSDKVISCLSPIS